MAAASDAVGLALVRSLAAVRAEHARHYAEISAALEAAGQALSVRVFRFTGSRPEEFQQVFGEIKRSAEAVIVAASSFMAAHRSRLAELAVQHRLPTMHEWMSYAEAGGLASYGPKLPHLSRRAAHHVDRILEGAKPADIPVEQPTEFELVINARTAKRIGLSIPRALLLRADQVID